MVARTTVRPAVALSLVIAVVAILVASQSRALISFGHDRFGSAPAAAPAVTSQSQPAVNAGTATLKHGQSQAPTTGADNAPGTTARNPSATIRAGGPADAGPDVVYQAPVSTSQSCGPRPCRRP